MKYLKFNGYKLQQSNIKVLVSCDPIHIMGKEQLWR